MERTVFSTKDAAAYLGMSQSTFTHQIYKQQRIKPLRVNQRLIVFSREQLDDYRRNELQTNLEFEAEFYTFADAAALLGLDLKEMRELVASGAIKAVDDTTIGGQFIYTRDELERVATERGWTLDERGTA